MAHKVVISGSADKTRWQLMQGCSLSPSLINYFLDGILECISDDSLRAPAIGRMRIAELPVQMT